MDPTETVEAYYEALRRGDPLAPFFTAGEDVVKFGVSERLAGSSAVAEALAEQTRTTEDWRVESTDLRVTARDSAHGGSSPRESRSPSRTSVAWFTDAVALAWTDSTGVRHSFDTRWSGVLEREEDSNGAENDWQFAQMHVSAPHDL